MAGGYDLYLEKEGGNAKYAYMNQPSAIGSTVARFTLGTNYQLDSSDSANYYHYDEAGNVILITNGSGNVVSHFEQDAWGNDLNSTFGSDIAQHQTSKYYDSVTGLYFFGARWYNPAIGRYISVSPIAIIDEEEYVYCNSDPINQVDKDGRCAFVVGAIIGAGADAWTQLYETGGTSVDWGRVGVAALSGAVGGQIGSWIDAGLGKVVGSFARFQPKITKTPNGSWFPKRVVPHSGRPGDVLDSECAHTALGWSRDMKYPQAREFGENGKLIRDIDFTSHGNPSIHPNPHQHEWLPGPTGGSPMRGGPIEWP